MRRDNYCILIVGYPRQAYVQYLDSSRDKPKDYSKIKDVIDKAITGYAAKVGDAAMTPVPNAKRVRGCIKCVHMTNFPSLKQSDPENGMDAWFAILQMREHVRDRENLLLPSSLRARGVGMAEAEYSAIRSEFRTIQRTICSIIHNEVCTAGGVFFYNHVRPTNDEIKARILRCRDPRPFNSLDGCLNFPPPQ